MNKLSSAGFRLPVNCLYAAMLGYIYLGILLFLLGWCVWYISVPCSMFLLYVVYKMLCDYRTDEYLAITPSRVACIVIMGVVLYAIGWGRFTEQAEDWYKHNALIYDLIKYDWPVIYENDKGEKAMLTYYVAQYLFPCLVGKLAGSCFLGEIVHALWAYFGLALVYLNLLRIVGNSRMFDFVVLFVLLFFCYPTSVGRYILSFFIDGNQAEGPEFCYIDNVRLEYSGNIVLLRWVFPQVIVNWMVSTIFWEHYKKMHLYVPLILPTMIYGSFSFLGLFPYALAYPVYRLATCKDKMGVVRGVFSRYNLLTALTLGTVVVVYLLGNVAGEKPSDMSFRLMDYSGGKFIIYIVFVCTMVVPCLLLLFISNRRNWIYHVTVASLLALPLFSMGAYNDFTMRCSIPALFFMMIMVLAMFRNYRHARVGTLVMAVLLAYSSKGFVYETIASLENDKLMELAPFKTYGSLGRFADKTNPEIEAPYRFNYFTYEPEKSIFLNYLAR